MSRDKSKLIRNVPRRETTAAGLHLGDQMTIAEPVETPGGAESIRKPLLAERPFFATRAAGQRLPGKEF